LLRLLDPAPSPFDVGRHLRGELSHSPSTASGTAVMPFQNDPCHELSCLESGAIALRVIDSRPLVGVLNAACSSGL